jgi:hypothetical protein
MENLLTKYPDRIPVIIKNENVKLLVKSELPMREFMVTMRKKIKISSKQAIFIFVKGGILPAMNITIGELYNMYRSDDSILYIEYKIENTFG